MPRNFRGKPKIIVILLWLRSITLKMKKNKSRTQKDCATMNCHNRHTHLLVQYFSTLNCQRKCSWQYYLINMRRYASRLRHTQRSDFEWSHRTAEAEHAHSHHKNKNKKTTNKIVRLMSEPEMYPHSHQTEHWVRHNAIIWTLSVLMRQTLIKFELTLNSSVTNNGNKKIAKISKKKMFRK